jgi:hypothetical protein
MSVFDTKTMHYPEEIFAKIGQSRCFAKGYLCKGYWQISMRDEDKDITSFLTLDGLFRFKVMPFGLPNAMFNRMVRILLRDLKDTDSFIDDLLIHS